MNDEELLVLKKIIDDNPNLYLDEIVLLLIVQTGKALHYSTIHRYITHHFSYTLQSITAAAKQQCEENQNAFLTALKMLLQGDPDRLVMIDESHKDRNASRRRRGWSLCNSGGVRVKEWYRNVVRYTLIAAADVNGFIPASCQTVLREENSETGASGTVDGEFFLDWIKTYLCPVLGRYQYGEPRSVVFMDNAVTHMSHEVESAINDTGAVLIYGAPYSPHLNPIENYFFIYKVYLKRNQERMNHHWNVVHMEGLQQVDHRKGIKYFKRCHII